MGELKESDTRSRVAGKMLLWKLHIQTKVIGSALLNPAWREIAFSYTNMYPEVNGTAVDETQLQNKMRVAIQSNQRI